MNEFRRRVMESGGKEYPLGIFAYYSDGSIKDYEHADSNAIGVAVVTENCRFVIGLDGTYNKQIYNQNINCVDLAYLDEEHARVDYDGLGNTQVMIATYGDSTTYIPGFTYSKTLGGNHGYLPSLGEVVEVQSRLTLVNNMITKCGGSTIDVLRLRTSTYYGKEGNGYSFWRLRMDNNVASYLWLIDAMDFFVAYPL